MKVVYGPYSPSRLDTATCPFLFKKTYIDQEPRARTQSLAAARGAAVHEVFEKMTKMMVKSDKEVSFTKNMLQEMVVEAVKANPQAYPETRDILDMAIRYAKKPPYMLTTDADVEARFGVKMGEEGIVESSYDDPNTLARGRADIQMISDDLKTAFIFDHKTQPNIEPADTFQLGFYAWVMFRSNPYLQTVKTVLHFARFGYYSEPYEWTREQLEGIEDEIMTRIMIIENCQDWSPIPYKGCQYCPYLTECPINKEYFEVAEKGVVPKPGSFKILGNTAQAVKAAGSVYILEEIVKKLKAELKDHVKKSGVGVAIPGMVFEHRVKDDVHWDKVNKTMKNELYKVFEKHGKDPRDYMSFNNTATNHVWKSEGAEALVKELAAKLPRKKSTTFKGYKI